MRFFVTPELLQKDRVVLTDDNAMHAKVLRIKKSDQVVVCDGKGNECLCAVDFIDANQIGLVVTYRRQSKSEPSVKVSIFMAFSKADKFEHVIQKATEIGAFEIVAFPSARCVSKPEPNSLKKKLERWQKIAVAAAEQSGRAYVPQVKILTDYAQALEMASFADIGILFYENEQVRTLHSALNEKKYSSVSLLTGPEGGLEPFEVEEALNKGLQVCTLGRRILRCETAPLCALTAVMYDSGEF